MGAKSIRGIDGVATVAVVSFGVAIAPFSPRPLAGGAGVLLCVVITGVILAAAIMPSRGSSTARLAAMGASSLGVGIFGGLALNCVPGGLGRVNWLVYGLVVALVGYLIARSRGATTVLGSATDDIARPSRASVAKALAATGILCAAVVVSVSSFNEEKTFTEVWLVPDGTSHSPIGATTAVLGIKSHEGSTEQFTVVMNTGSRTLTTEVTLSPNDEWSQSFPVEGERPEAVVFRGKSDSDPYRTVWLVTR